MEYIKGATEQEKLKKLSKDELVALKEDLLLQISFFQHERFIHLIVTVLFALCAVAVLIAMTYFKSVAMLILFVLILVLLFPYIIHYFHLENGVQELYTYYDRIIGKSFGEKKK
ncbi:MAG: hypothetical protein K2M82_04595 [Lachnospiraceae bacterium]|nr:hypothetical protein [Lachnospiraceae bacterium]